MTVESNEPPSSLSSFFPRLEADSKKNATDNTRRFLRNMNFQSANLPFPLGVWKQFEVGASRSSVFYRRVVSHRVKVLPCHEVHESSREPAILTGYRQDKCSLAETFWSLLYPTNETMNFWSHFVAAAYFVWRFLLLTEKYDFWDDSYVWPLIPYFFTAFLYPFMSSVAHGFCCLGFTVRHICFFLDYGAISIYSFGCAILYRAYIFPVELFGSYFEGIFIHVSILNSIIATILTCLSRFIPDEKRNLQKGLRIGWFVVSYLWESIPLVTRIVNCPLHHGWGKVVFEDGEPICDRLAIYHYFQIVAICIAAVCYATRIPEKFFPGRFDFFGNSHHFLHIFGVLATYFQMEGGLIDVEHRREYLTSSGQLLDKFSSFVMPFTVIGVNFLILIAFSCYVIFKCKDDVTLCKKEEKCC